MQQLFHFLEVDPEESKEAPEADLEVQAEESMPGGPRYGDSEARVVR